MTELRIALPAEACTDAVLGELSHMLHEFPGSFPVRGLFIGSSGMRQIDFGVGVSGNGFLPLAIRERFGIEARFASSS